MDKTINMFSLLIKDVKKEMHIATNTEFLDVQVDILNTDEKLVESRRFAYNVETSEETIKEDLDRFLKVYSEDLERGVLNKGKDEVNAKAEVTAEALKGTEITLQEEEVEKKSKNNK